MPNCERCGDCFKSIYILERHINRKNPCISKSEPIKPEPIEIESIKLKPIKTEPIKKTKSHKLHKLRKLSKNHNDDTNCLYCNKQIKYSEYEIHKQTCNNYEEYNNQWDKLMDTIKEEGDSRKDIKKDIGYIYLLQDGKHINQGIYKIGKSVQCSSDTRTLNRIKSYSHGTIQHFLIEVPINYLNKVEKAIKNTFSENYTLVEGTEWFSGNVDEMKVDIMNIMCELYEDPSFKSNSQNQFSGICNLITKMIHNNIKDKPGNIQNDILNNLIEGIANLPSDLRNSILSDSD